MKSKNVLKIINNQTSLFIEKIVIIIFIMMLFGFIMFKV